MLTKITQKVREILGLTKSEAGIILFLSFGIVAGGTVKLLHLDRSTERYDFSQSDTYFAAASSKIDSVIAAEEDTVKANRHSTSTASGIRTKPAITSPIDINKASFDDLLGLPGVGKAMAGRIVAYRISCGKFNSVEDLLKVKGIGDKKLEKIRTLVKVE